MFKHLGTLAILAVCFFAMLISGCPDGVQDGGQDIVSPPVAEPVVEEPVTEPPITLPVALPPPIVGPDGMALIPSGSFEMGSEDAEAYDNEQPVHTVHINAFFMDEHEVTNAQFKRFIDANPQWGRDNIEDRFHWGGYLHDWDGNNYPSGRAEHAVVWVSWYAALAYAEWAGKRLPTEAEWEYAARGGLAGKKYPWGDTISRADANYNEGGTTLVGQYAANGYGLFDMAGNVEEWCLDAWVEDFYAVSGNSRNPISGGETIQWVLDNFTTISTDPPRVLRGGSGSNSAFYLRVAKRSLASPRATLVNIGFRCVKDITP